jgi:hypothetical protein
MNSRNNIEFAVFTGVAMKFAIFWDIASGSPQLSDECMISIIRDDNRPNKRPASYQLPTYGPTFRRKESPSSIGLQSQRSKKPSMLAGG